LAYDDFIEGKTTFIKNIEYLGSGYHIVFGNTRPTSGIDPGYTNYKAFKMEYDADKLKALSYDGDYFVPKGVLLKT
jgi:hypothetical protein